MASRAGSVLHHHVYVEPPRLSSLLEGVPAELDRLVAELLAKDPDRRPTATETATVLGELARVVPTGGASTGRAGPAGPGSAADGLGDAPTIAPDAVDAPTVAPDALAATEAHLTPEPPPDEPRQDVSRPAQ